MGNAIIWTSVMERKAVTSLTFAAEAAQALEALAL